MITTEQLAAAHAFLATCAPANALRLRPPTQTQRSWQAQLQTAQAARHAARTAMQDLCGTRAVYQEAIAAAQASNKLG
jgi:hypothetical protein